MRILLIDIPCLNPQHHQHLAGILDSQPVDDLPSPLLHDHVQECHTKMISNASISDHLVPEDDQPQVVDILTVVLLDKNVIK